MINRTKRNLWTALVLCLALCMTVFTGCKARDGSTSSGSSSSMSSSSSSSGSSQSSSSSKPDPVPPESPSSEPMDPSSSSSSSSESSSEPATATGSADFSKIGALDGASVTWGPGKNFDGDNRPTACVGLQQQFEQYGALFLGQPGKDGKKAIYLTFDQGYENGYTAKILDTLKEKQAPAVFFLTGHYVETSPELIERMAAEGHVLGNHSNRHIDATEAPLERVQQDLAELRDMVQEQFGAECRLYRFPEGKFSEQTLALVQQEGFTPVFWSFAYADWDPENQPAEAAALEQLTARLHDGAIYLLHSVSATNAAILGDFIDAARAQGYEFYAVGK